MINNKNSKIRKLSSVYFEKNIEKIKNIHITLKYNLDFVVTFFNSNVKNNRIKV